MAEEKDKTGENDVTVVDIHKLPFKIGNQELYTNGIDGTIQRDDSSTVDNNAANNSEANKKE